MNKEVVHIYNGILFSHKRKEIVPFAKMWVDLQAVIYSEISQKETKCILYNITYVWNERYSTDELICKAEIGTQMQRTNIWIPSAGKGMDELGDWGCHIYTAMY